MMALPCQSPCRQFHASGLAVVHEEATPETAFGKKVHRGAYVLTSATVHVILDECAACLRLRSGRPGEETGTARSVLDARGRMPLLPVAAHESWSRVAANLAARPEFCGTLQVWRVQGGAVSGHCGGGVSYCMLSLAWAWA